MTTYDVKLRVTLSMLPTLLQVIEKTKGVELVNVSAPVSTNGVEPPPAPIRIQSYVGGIKNKGISGVDLILEILRNAGGPVVRTHIDKVFEQRGFAASSVSPSISRLMRDKLIRRPTSSTLVINEG